MVLLNNLALRLLPPADDLNLRIFLIRIDIKSIYLDVISSRILILSLFNSLLAFKILNLHSLFTVSFTCSTLGTAATCCICGLVWLRWGCKAHLLLWLLFRFPGLTDRIRLCHRGHSLSFLSNNDVVFLIGYLRERLRLNRWGSGRELLCIRSMMTPNMLLMMFDELFLRSVLPTEWASHSQFGSKREVFILSRAIRLLINSIELLTEKQR